MQNLVEEIIWSMLAQKSLKALGTLRLFSLGEKIYLLRRVFKVSPFSFYTLGPNI